MGRFTDMVVYFLEMKCNTKFGKGALESYL